MTGLLQRLYSQLVMGPETSCLLWTGSRTGDGYGQIAIGSRADRTFFLVHRLMYTVFSEPVPAGQQLDHLCRVRHCANVAHLEPVSSRENTLRGTGPSAINAAKERCVNDHPYDLINTYLRSDGSRACRECKRAVCRRWRAARRSALTAGGAP